MVLVARMAGLLTPRSSSGGLRPRAHKDVAGLFGVFGSTLGQGSVWLKGKIHGADKLRGERGAGAAFSQ